jgi:hypothetical protein
MISRNERRELLISLWMEMEMRMEMLLMLGRAIGRLIGFFLKVSSQSQL